MDEHILVLEVRCWGEEIEGEGEGIMDEHIGPHEVRW